MQFYIEVKFMGDAYGANYGNGLSMCGSQSVQGFSRQKDNGDSEVWTDNRNHKIVVHKNKVRDATEITTEFFNESDTPVTLEMISSFAVKEIGLLKDCGFGYLKVDYNDTIGVWCVIASV